VTAWKATHLRCDCCARGIPTAARDAAAARAVAARKGWTQNRSKTEDWCPNCAGFKCKGQH
jgi:hypothetical protein